MGHTRVKCRAMGCGAVDRRMGNGKCEQVARHFESWMAAHLAHSHPRIRVIRGSCATCSCCSRQQVHSRIALRAGGIPRECLSSEFFYGRPAHSLSLCLCRQCLSGSHALVAGHGRNVFNSPFTDDPRRLGHNAPGHSLRERVMRCHCEVARDPVARTRRLSCLVPYSV